DIKNPGFCRDACLAGAGRATGPALASASSAELLGDLFRDATGHIALSRLPILVLNGDEAGRTLVLHDHLVAAQAIGVAALGAEEAGEEAGLVGLHSAVGQAHVVAALFAVAAFNGEAAAVQCQAHTSPG